MARAQQRSRRRRLEAMLVALLLMAGLVVAGLRSIPSAARVAGRSSPQSVPSHFIPTPPPATPCKTLIPECNARRLPDLILTGGQKFGLLRSVDGFDLSNVISFDEALRRAWGYSHHEQATTVQVILGSADVAQWGSGKRLYYGIEWGGLCNLVIAPTPVPGYSPAPKCGGTTWGTVIDAITGDFVVEG